MLPCYSINCFNPNLLVICSGCNCCKLFQCTEVVTKLCCMQVDEYNLFAAMFMPIFVLNFLWIWNLNCLLLQTTWSITIIWSKLRIFKWLFISLCRLNAIWYFFNCFGVLFFSLMHIFKWNIKPLIGHTTS